jgi:hypothetical protein
LRSKNAGGQYGQTAVSMLDPLVCNAIPWTMCVIDSEFCVNRTPHPFIMRPTTTARLMIQRGAKYWQMVTIACLSSLCSDALVMYPLDPRLQVGTRKPPHCPSREVSYELPALIRTPPIGDRRLLCAVDQSQGLRCELKWRDHHLCGPSVRFMTTGAETVDKYEEDVEVGVGCRVHRAVSGQLAGPLSGPFSVKKKLQYEGFPCGHPP